MSWAISAPLRRSWGLASLGLLCASLLFLVACEKKRPPPPPPPRVTVSQPLRRSVTDYLEYTGNTQAVNTVQLRARVEGYLDGVFFRDGDRVKKNQLLFLIQQNTYFAQLQQAEGNVMTQKALLEHAQIEYARYGSLYRQKAAAETDVENWRYQRDSAQAGLASAQAQRDLAKLNLGYTWVTAPFDGRIDRRLVDPGNLVGSGGASTVLAEMTQLDPLYVYFNVSEADVALLVASGDILGKDGAASRPVFMGLAGESGYPHEGRLDFVATSVDTGTGTLLLRGVFENREGKMLPGQFARVKMPVGVERAALLVPRVAVAFDQLGSYVLVVDEENTVERRAVKTGSVQDGMYVIDEGLAEDEWVIVRGLVRAAPGRRVTPERQRTEKPRAETGPTKANNGRG